MVVRVEAALDSKRDLSGDSLALGCLCRNSKGTTWQESIGGTTNGAGGCIDLERELERRGDGEVGEEGGRRSNLWERNTDIASVGSGIKREGGNH